MVYIFFIFKKRLPLLQADRTRVLFVVCVYFFQDEKNILSGDCVLKSLIYIFFNLCLTYQHYTNAVYNFLNQLLKTLSAENRKPQSSECSRSRIHLLNIHPN